MENSILVALSLQSTLRRNLDVIANNVANVNSSGFKAERLVTVAQPVASRQPTIDGRVETSFVRDLVSVRDPSEGRLDATDNPLDLALRGDGYFVVSTPAGERYTRNGHYRLDEAGRLVNEEGYALQGQGGGTIQFSPEDARIDVARDGTVSSEVGTLGKIRVVQFANPQALQPEAGGLATSTETPSDVAAPDVVQGMIERSNVEPILEIDRMIRVQRAYDQAKTVVDREDERIRKMIVVFVE